MPDVSVLPTGGMESRGGGGPNWLLIGAVGVGAIFLLLMLTGKGKSAGQPTTAAGNSINAALGSIQEQNLNIMGEVGMSEQRLSAELNGINNNIIVGNQGLAHSIMGLGQAVDINRMVLSQMPGGGYAYQAVVNSPASQAFATEADAYAWLNNLIATQATPLPTH